MQLSYAKVTSPVGKLILVADDQGLRQLTWENISLAGMKNDPSHKVLQVAIRQLEEYFEGRRKNFAVKLSPAGTQFQRKVWRALAAIPYGKTVSYADIAKKVGAPKGFRAVGSANGKNPLPIIVPCHRVVGKDGSLGGFSGGLHRKSKLLAIEGLALNS